MKFSAFAQFGHLSFTSKPSVHEQFYRAYVANVQGAFDMTKGTHAEATAFARSKAAARASRTLTRAGNQSDPLKATEILPNLEKDFGVIPGPFQDTPSRRRAVSALEKLPAGGTYLNIRAALQTLLGSDFLAYRLLSGGEVTNYPAAPSGSTEVNCVRVDQPAKTLATLDPVAILGSPIWVSYQNLDPTLGEAHLNAGDVVMVQPENTGAAEKLIVAAVQGSGSTRQFQATFTKAHDIGSVVTTANWPSMWSTRRFALIVVVAAAAIDPERRRKVDVLMHKMARSVSQWAIVQPTTPGALTVGPFSLPSPLGAVPLGQTTFSLLP